MFSTLAAEGIQMQRLNHQEPGLPSVTESDRRSRFADGHIDEAQQMVDQPTTSGPLAGKSIKTHLIDCAGNETSPLFSKDMMRRLRMVVDYGMKPPHRCQVLGANFHLQRKDS